MNAPSHEHHPVEKHTQGSRDIHGTGQIALRRAVVLTLSFMVVEFVGGFLANSLALMSDALHMLTDSAGLMLSLVAFWIAARPGNSRMSYGYHRAEILGALTGGILIWFLTAVLVYEGILRLRTPPEVKGFMVFGVAAIGLLVNLIVARILGSAHTESLNLKAAYLHVLGDLLGSVGAIAAGLVIWLTGWTLIDALVTFMVAGLLLYGSSKIVREALDVLMESTPRGINPDQVRAALAALEAVEEVHDLHIWTVASGFVALSVHLVSSHPAHVLEEADALLEEKFGIRHTTIQVEHPDRFRSDRCYDCIAETGRE